MEKSYPKSLITSQYIERYFDCVVYNYHFLHILSFFVYVLLYHSMLISVHSFSIDPIFPVIINLYYESSNRATRKGCPVDTFFDYLIATTLLASFHMYPGQIGTVFNKLPEPFD